jgi:2,5-diketo-D-gluconate reductase A
LPAIPTVTLNNGVVMPQVGFGVFQVDPGETEQVVRTAIEAGYTSIDTAAVYGNEEGVGRAIASFPRDDLFITTKLWNTDQGRDSTLRAFDTSMAKLGLDVLDLYLIHWPVPAQAQYAHSWRAMQELYRDGRVRAIGVSNFQPAHLRRLFLESDVKPVLNQVELHPYFPQTELRAFHAEHEVHTEAWSPLGQGGDLLEDKALLSLAEQHGVEPAQVVLRWHLQKGTIVIPKSVTPARIASNLDLAGFELTPEEMAQIDGLDRGTRLGPDPDHLDATG